MPAETGDKSSGTLVASNRRARHDYFVDESLEAGLVLAGSEVKSVRSHHVSITEAYATVEGGQVWLHGMRISPYEPARDNTEPTRDRKLLLHRHQIERIRMKMQLERLTLVPTKLYFSDGKVKVEMALGKGKSNIDKRQDLAKRQSDRDAAREIANARRRTD